MIIRRRSVMIKYFLAFVLGAVLYNEWFVYAMQPYYWHNIKCPQEDTSCTKIMFIADPQIQGEMAKPPPLSYLFNWDSDRFLRSTFTVALKHFQPDVLVYLGDLMDEGSIATMVQFHYYVKRLSNIFDVSYPVTQVWLPGDNDIGGENEPIRKDKLEEFEKVFDQPAVINFKNISFYKVNGITHSFPHSTENDNYKIVVSHYPTLWRSPFGKQVNEAIQPNVYFCAHEHKSKYMIKDKDWRNVAARILKPGDSVLSIEKSKGDIYEIYVPTCSYRMGTDSIGYGAAIVENNQLMRYTVFWSPRRFPYLYVYAAFLIIIVIYTFIYCLGKMIYTCSSVPKTSSTVPLLQII
ncbi:metallophosphoesterase 1 [Battus philenor]|uniref:metallophosphoesterase 1 n=1 Tax=Battus philenor TaxID=42288 RepID=UPI0035CF823A